MLTSKDIIERTGISRATLNNYIASGLVPRPQVLAPGPDDDSEAPRIGHFPDDTIERIETIQRLKREGWSMGRIAEHFADGPAPDKVLDPDAIAAAVGPPAMPPAGSPPVAPLSGARPSVPARSLGLRPSLTRLAVLVGTLEDAAGLWTRLSAQEYFELVNEVWAELEPVFQQHEAIAGRHGEEGLVRYFLPQRIGSHLWSALAAAWAAREAMRQISHRWELRKGWGRVLSLNVGIDAGEAWMGAIGPAERRVIGEAADRAEQLSRASRAGAILVTRDLIGQMAESERRRVLYGVPRSLREQAAGHALFTFERLEALAAPSTVPARVAGLAAAELLDLGEGGATFAAPSPQA